MEDIKLLLSLAPHNSEKDPSGFAPMEIMYNDLADELRASRCYSSNTFKDGKSYAQVAFFRCTRKAQEATK